MYRVIITDTSCLILLEKIGELHLLQKLFGTVFITPEIAEEYGLLSLPSWIVVQEPADKRYQLLLEYIVDRGEASAIALATECNPSLLVVDDLKARRLAKKFGLVITGTFGIIIEAKANGFIPSVKLILKKIKQTNFRISEDLEKEILKKSGEL
ncbi:MAG TPA: DUF3368 domain-containing protein [Niabella sp.]|nr:DUF3368 domain-containing protein [Niabella sp.]